MSATTRIWADIIRSIFRNIPKGQVEYRVQWRNDGHDDARIVAADARRARRRDRNLRAAANGGWR